jgi:ethanolamine utilization cobalamin adenosyltransferase
MTAHVIDKFPLFLVLDSQDLNVLKRSELPKRYLKNASIFSCTDNVSLFICLCLKVTHIKEAETVGLCVQKLVQSFPSFVVEERDHITKFLNTPGNVRLAGNLFEPFKASFGEACGDT